MDNTKFCWFCRKETVKPKASYYQCSECGATYNVLPQPSSFGLVEEPAGDYARDTKYRPSRKRGRAKAKGKR